MQPLIPIDGGPIYAETDLSAWMSEPWNAWSSLAIALPSVIWAIRLKWDYRRFPFLFFLIPLLFLGGLGSTLYHAFRASKLLLWMDVYPTAVVTFSVSVYFWNKILQRRWQVASIMVPFVILRFFFLDQMSGHLAVNLSYFTTGVFIFLPLLILLINTNFRHFSAALASIFFLSVSLVMRRIDHAAAEYLPMGSHFLWHILSGFGAYYLAKFLFLIRSDELSVTKQDFTSFKTER
ncbi:MAG: hypothetical protein AAF616_04640 [Bacteroidota bacterium]